MIYLSDLAPVDPPSATSEATLARVTMLHGPCTSQHWSSSELHMDELRKIPHVTACTVVQSQENGRCRGRGPVTGKLLTIYGVLPVVRELPGGKSTEFGFSR
jgi:hypothetical protein